MLKTHAEMTLRQMIDDIGQDATTPQVSAAVDNLPWIKGNETPAAVRAGMRLSDWFVKLNSVKLEWDDAKNMFFTIQELLEEIYRLKAKYDQVVARTIGVEVEKQAKADMVEKTKLLLR